MFLCSNNEVTKFSNDKVINTAVLAGSYIACMLLAGLEIPNLKLSPVNPTVGFSIFFMN